jgi:hypothetical protein
MNDARLRRLLLREPVRMDRDGGSPSWMRCVELHCAYVCGFLYTVEVREGQRSGTS